MKKLILLSALLIFACNFGQKADEYFSSGLDKTKVEDYSGAISDFTKAIEIDPNYAIAYARRGNRKVS
jgi:lipoprotein NlpI